MIKLDLPTKGEIKHLIREGLLQEIKYSDYARLTIEPYVNVLDLIYKGELKKEEFYLNAIWLKDGSVAYNDDNKISFAKVTPINPIITIIPVIRDRKIYDDIIKHDVGDTIGYLKWPLFATKESELHDELDEEYKNNRLLEIDNHFVGVRNSYFHKCQRYVRMIVKTNPERDYKNRTIYSYNKVYLSNGGIYEENNHAWLKVDFIEWIIDRKNKILVSKYPLIGGIPFKSDRITQNDVKFYLDIIAKNFDFNSQHDYQMDNACRVFMDQWKQENEILKQMIINKYGLSTDGHVINDGGTGIVLKK